METLGAAFQDACDTMWDFHEVVQYNISLPGGRAPPLLTSLTASLSSFHPICGWRALHVLDWRACLQMTDLRCFQSGPSVASHAANSATPDNATLLAFGGLSENWRLRCPNPLAGATR